MYTRGESNSPVSIQDFKWSLNSLQPIRRRPKTEKSGRQSRNHPSQRVLYTEMLSVVGSAIQSALIYAGAVPDLILDPRLPAPTLYLSLLKRTQKISTCIYCARSADEWREREGDRGRARGVAYVYRREKRETRWRSSVEIAAGGRTGSRVSFLFSAG
jgi:hypothetical protein